MLVDYHVHLEEGPLDILLAYEVPITLSSDAHFPDDLGTLIKDNAKLLKDSPVARFKKRNRL